MNPATGPAATIEPMLATAGPLPAPAVAERYGYEMKWDGVRAVVVVGPTGVRLYSRSGREMTATYPELAGLGAGLGAGTVLDGEVVAFDASGRPSFGVLQPRMLVSDAGAARKLAATIPCVWLGFDLLRLRGADLLAVPYAARRDELEALGLAAPGWQVPPYLPGDADAALELSRGARLEGVVAKLLTSRYEPGRRSPSWIKVKHVATQAVVVGGWRYGRGGLAGGLGAVLMGLPAGDGTLTYAGRVGTGLSHAGRRELLARLQGLGPAPNPFGPSLPRADAREVTFVPPVLVGEVGYVEWTRDGRLRAPVWRGLRPDVDVAAVVREDGG